MYNAMHNYVLEASAVIEGDDGPEASMKLFQDALSKYNEEIRDIAVSKQGRSRKRRLVEASELQVPKKPVSSFMHFMRSKRAQIIRENPDVPANAISKIAGQIWRSMSNAEKKFYDDMTRVDKERYTAELRAIQSKKMRIGLC